MEKIKIIQLAHSSESFALGESEKDLKKLILNDWFSKVSKQIKKFYPGLEVECWAPERIYKKEEKYIDSNVLFRFFPTTFSFRYALDFSIPMLSALKKEIKKSKQEKYKLILHVHEIHNLHGLLIATFFKNQNIIVQHHGGSYPIKHLKQSKNYRFFYPFFILGQMWENLVLKNIPYYYVLSNDETNYLKKVAPLSILKFQTMGIEDDLFKNMRKNIARKRLKIPLNKKILLYIGRVAEIKGMYYLLEAMRDLKDYELKCIGFSSEEQKFKDYVKINRLNNVEFLGGIFGIKKFEYLHAADLLVLPSLKEGAPVVVMEAVASNLPVVVTDVGGVKKMIENEREGYIIRQHSSQDIVKAVNKILKWKKKDIKKYAEKYRWKKIVDGTVKDYEML